MARCRLSRCGSRDGRSRIERVRAVLEKCPELAAVRGARRRRGTGALGALGTLGPARRSGYPRRERWRLRSVRRRRARRAGGLLRILALLLVGGVLVLLVLGPLDGGLRLVAPHRLLDPVEDRLVLVARGVDQVLHRGGLRV